MLNPDINMFKMPSVQLEATLLLFLRGLHHFDEDRSFHDPYTHGYFYMELDDD